MGSRANHSGVRKDKCTGGPPTKFVEVVEPS